MLRFLKRRTKKDIIQYNYDPINEIVQNGSFARGSFISDVSNVKSYNLDSWTWQEGGTSSVPGFTSPITPSTGTLTRVEIYDGAYGILENNYVRFDSADASSNAVYRWIKSTDLEILQGEKLSFSIDTRYKNVFTDDGSKRQAYILLYGNVNNYFLKDDGTWVQTNATFSTNENYFSTSYLTSGDPLFSDWITLSVDSQPCPDFGNINIILLNDFRTWESGGQESWYKSLQVQVLTGFNGQYEIDITGVQSIFTKADNLKMVDQSEIYFDDSFSNNFKGTLLRADGVSLTDRQWHRSRYVSEIEGFRKENAIAHWQFNRIDRNKIDANFFGLTWDDGTEPIGLINTIKFVDDDPNKIYAILNLKEIDFASSTWNATLLEVFDNDRDVDDYVLKNFDADPTNNTYIGITKVPWTIVSGADFTISTGNTFTYTGTTSISPSISCVINGTINSLTSGTDVIFNFIINGVSKAIQVVDCTTLPKLFTLNLSNISTINSGNTMFVSISNNVDEINIGLGNLTFSYYVPGTPTYDPYQVKYIYQ
jgi:hypothetical protein